MRTHEEQLESARKWGANFSEWLRKQDSGCTVMIGRTHRHLVYRLLGCMSKGGYMQISPEWRDRLKAAGLDADWNVVDQVLWEHAVWQVETTGVFRPERQAGLHELVSSEVEAPTRPAVKQQAQSDGEASLGETLNRLLKR